MNAYADLRMPAHYVDMSQKEMKYEGGFAWIPICSAISIGCFVASCAVTIAQKAGWIDTNTARAASVGLAVVGTVTGVASGIGTLWTGGAGLSAGKALLAFTGVTADPAMSFANTVIHW